jgi:hypothetical protein
MKYRPSSKSRREGSMLLAAIIFLFIGFSIAALTLRDAMHNSRMVDSQVTIERSHYMAEAGAEQAADRIGKFTGPEKAFSGVVPGSKSGGGGESWRYEITRPAGTWHEFKIQAIGDVNGVERQLNIERVRYPTFAQYGMWTSNFRDIWMIPGQIQNGHFHSDNRINIWSSAAAGGPVFKGKVTTGHHEFGGWPAYSTFEQGHEFNSDQGTMASIDFDEMETEATHSGMLLKGETSVYFDLDTSSGAGQMYLKNHDRYGNNGWHAEPLSNLKLVYVKDKLDDNGALLSSGKIQLFGGTVDGALTFYAEDDIHIRDHMYYKNDPRDDENVFPDYPEPSDDKIGFISKDDIWVSTSAPDNLEVFGAFIAAGPRNPGDPTNKGNIGVTSYSSFLYGPRGSFTTYGSRVMEEVYPAGTFNSRTGQQQTGYYSKNEFDKRFINDPPPYYPELKEKLLFEGWSYSEVGFTSTPVSPGAGIGGTY